MQAGQARDEDTSWLTHSGSLTEQLIIVNPVTFNDTYRPMRPKASQHSRSKIVVIELEIEIWNLEGLL
jgi:hypothetical protein